MALPAADLNKKADHLTTMELGAVLPLTAEVIDDHLYIGGVDMVELARTQGTALYVMDEADMRNRMATYLEAFRSRYENSDVIFASKAFLNKAAAKIVAEEGLGLDVSGGGELAIARAAGFPMEKVFVHGNNKTPLELEEAIDAGVGRIVIDSRIELARVSDIAGKLGKVQDIYMRITPGVEADTHEYIRTGCEDSKFGFNMRNDWAFNCVKDVLDTPNVRLAGLHMHIGSQIFALHSFGEAVQVMVELMARIKREYGYIIEELDVGGGLGIAYTAGDKPSSIEDFAECVTTAVKRYCAENDLALPRLLCEPGRSLVATAGVTLYTVGILKTLP
ncbi:MAG: diaminopimelate decarboxylase, partial [Raoultibacter sp.]